VDYFYAFSPAARRKDPDRRFKLLSLVSKDEDTPLLPLPQVVTPETESTLHSLLKSDDNLSEFMANLMGSGPWTLQMALTVPSADGTLHFSNKNKRAPIEISHTLKVVVRVQRDNEREVDPHTGKPKKYDIVMRTSVHILSVRPLQPLELEREFYFVVDMRLCSFSICPTPSTPRSRATPRASGLHAHQKHSAPLLGAVRALFVTRVALLYYRVRLGLVSSVLSPCLKGVQPKWTPCTSVI
jgi:hypothetical protein